MTRLRRQTNQAEGNHNSPMLGDDHEDFFNSIDPKRTIGGQFCCAAQRTS